LRDRDQDEAARRRKPGRKPSRIAAWRLDRRAAERRRLHLVRLVLLGLSAGGVLLCIVLWAAGDGALALRVLAGLVVLVTGILLVV
jgi:hypothetical protein